jgi:group I intron endonuclease
MINDYTVYMHTFPNNKVYIGITCQNTNKRWAYGYGYRNTLVGNAIQKYGWENAKHEILFENLTKEEAEQKEIELIAYYKSNQRKYGYNIANGGNHKGKCADETKLKISKANSGNNNGMYGKKAWNKGKKMSIETRKKLSKVRKGKPISNYCKQQAIKANKERFAKGYMYTGIAREHIIKTAKENIKKAHNKNKKPVLKYSLDAVLIQEYSSLSEAARENSLNSSNISAVCLNKFKTCGGFIWKYKNDGKQIIPEIKGRHKNILQYDKNDLFIKKWFSIISASRELNINSTQILKCCQKKGKTAGGYKWSYE